MTVEHEPGDRQTLADIGPPLTAGVTLKAVDALEQQDTFTRAQLAYLIALAYQSGRAHAAAEDMAETAACWQEFAEPRTTREQRVAQRLADMQAQVKRTAQRPKTHPTLDVEWPEVAVPGHALLRAVA
jgi:hypothetical protein